MLVIGKTTDIPDSIMDRAPMQISDISSIPYPVSRGWDSETSILYSKQKSGLGAGMGVVMEFESEQQNGRSIVLATAQSESDLLRLGDAMLDPGILAQMSGDLALVKLDGSEYDLISLTVGKKYSTGNVGNTSWFDSILYANEYVVYAVIALVILVLSLILYWLLRRYRTRGARGK